MSWSINTTSEKNYLDAGLRVALEDTNFGEGPVGAHAQAQARKAIDAAFELARVVGGDDDTLSVQINGHAHAGVDEGGKRKDSVDLISVNVSVKT